MNKVYKTYWTKKEAPYGFFDDYVIFESRGEEFQMLEGEFDFLFDQLHYNCWKKNACKYIQIVKAWNELTGFTDVDENPSVIHDIQDTIETFALLRGVQDESFPGLMQADLDHLNAFFERHQHHEIKVFKK